MVNRVFSAEDGNLSSSIITTRKTRFIDIDLLFKNKPNGEIFKKFDAAAVKQSVKNLILTNHFEKPFQMFYGGNVRDQLFEMADTVTSSDIKDNIIRAIQSYEPRAIVRDLKVTPFPEENGISIVLTFQVTNSTEIITLSTNLTRLR